MENLSIGAKYIKEDISQIVKTWGMSAILEVLASIVESEMNSDEQTEYTVPLYSVLKTAERYSDGLGDIQRHKGISDYYQTYYAPKK